MKSRAKDSADTPEKPRLDQTEAEVLLKAFLKRKAMKFTAERAAILKAVMDIEGHFSMSDLFARITSAGGGAHRATIFRMLPIMEEAGIMKRVHRADKGQWTYEHCVGHASHEHLVCISCGRIVETICPLDQNMIEKICRENGFVKTNHRVTIFGFCEDCS